jgi:Tol biopolymer transport system component
MGALASTFTVPLSILLIGVYVMGLWVAWGVSFMRGRRVGARPSPVLSGMALCSLTLAALATFAGGTAAGVDYYRRRVVGACQALPQAAQVQGRGLNGDLALGALLPEPQGRPEQYVGQVISIEGELRQTVKDLAVARSVRDLAWSWDGRRLALIGLSADNRWGLYILEVGGDIGAPVLVSEMQMSSPAWSPDGTRLVFTRARKNSSNPDMEIYAVNADGSGLAALTDSVGYDGEARFSPDGRRIVFVSDRESYRDIFVMDADGANPQALTYANGSDISPAWSPDGQWIVFASDRVAQGVEQLYIMRADGSSQCRLTQTEDSSFSPAWSPDGRSIAYLDVSRSTLYLLSPDGSGVQAVPLAEGIRPLTVDWGLRP